MNEQERGQSRRPDRPENQEKPRRPKRWRRLFAWTLGAALVAVIALFAFIQTGPGKRLLAYAAEKGVAAVPGLSARVEGIGGFLPFSLTVKGLALYDERGVWLAVKDFSFAWSPAALFRGRVEVTGLSADTVRFLRPPVPPPSQEETPAPLVWPPVFPNLPPLLLDNVSFPRIILDEEAAGQNVTASLEGRLSEESGAVGFTLRAIRLDGPKAWLDLSGALNYADWTLVMHARAEEEAGGLLGTALDPSAKGPVTLALDGRGPLTAFAAKLSLAQAGNPLVASDLSLAVPLEKHPRITAGIDATVTPPTGLLPGDAAALLPGGLRLGVTAGTVLGKQTLYLDRLDVAAGPARLTASGFTDPDADSMDFKLGLDIPDLSPLSGLAGQPLSGTLNLTAALTGELMRPRGAIAITGDKLGTLEAGADKLALNFDLALPARLGDVFPGLDVTGGGRADGLRTASGPAPLGGTADIALDASVNERFAATLRKVSLTAGGATVALSGDVDPKGSLRVDGRVEAGDVAEIARLAGLPAKGALSLTLAASGDLGKERFEADLSGGLTGFSVDGGDQTAVLAADLLGKAPALSGRAVYGDGAAELSTFSLKGARLTLEASGKAGLSAGTLDARVKAALPDVSVLSGFAGRRLSGAVNLAVSASGALSSPDVTVKVEAPKLGADDLVLTGLALSADAADAVKAPRGALSLDAAMQGDRLAVKTRYALAGGRDLGLTDLAVHAPGFDLTGALSLDLSTGLASGTLKGGAADLSGLSALAGTPLAGELSLAAKLAAVNGGQDVSASLEANSLGAAGAMIQSVRLKADMRDVTRAPKGKLDLAVSGVAAQGASVSKATVKAEGDGKGAAFAVAAGGSLDALGDFSLDLAGRVDPGSSGGANLALSRLQAGLADLPVRLEKKMTASFGADSLALDGLSLAIGKGRFTASGGYGPGKADLAAKLAGLPLSTLAMFGGPELTGGLDVSLAVTGTGRAPVAHVTVKAAKAALAGDEYEDFPAMDLDVTADLGGGKAAAKVALSGLGKNPATLSAALPLTWGLAPFVFDLPPDGALSGSLAMDTQMKDLSGLLAAVNTRMSGSLKADFSLGGTLSGPSVRGAATLAGGTLQNADAGTNLKNMKLDVEADGTRIRLVEFSASDMKNGSMRVSGDVDLAADDRFSVDVEATLKKIILADMDLVKATGDGTVKVTGKGTDLDVTGDLFFGPVAVNIPSKLPQEVPQIEVVKVNDPDANDQLDEPAQPPEAARRVTLDLKVGLGDGVYVRGMGLESEWEGKLSITGTAAAPSITGKLSTLQGGGIEFFGRRLELTKGVITFNGASPPNPLLDIKTSIAASDATCGVIVTGDATSPKISLTSDPSMPKDEILARILFGQSAGRITAFQALQLAQASASLLTGGGSSLDVLSRTRKLAGLDELDFVPGQDGLGDTKLRAGKYLTKGVKVSVDQGMNADSGAVSVEVDITPNISLESRVGADSKQGVGVNWKWDY